MIVAIVSLVISLISVMTGMCVIIFYGTEGAYMLLAILGAPSTFLNYIFRWYTGSLPLPYFFTCFLYFLQYQLIALAIYKFHNKLTPLLYIILLGIIFASMVLMFCIQTGIW